MKNRTFRSLIFSLMLFAGVLTLTHCGAKNTDSSYDTTTAEVLGSTIANTASSSDDSSGTVVSAQRMTAPSFNLADILLPKAYAAACSTVAKVKGQSCSGSPAEDMSIDLNDCTTDLGLVSWMGTLDLAFGSGAVCTSAISGGVLGMGAGGEVTMTSTGLTRTVASGNYVTTDSGSSGFNTAESGGLEVTCVDATCGGGGGGASRTVDLLGLHRGEYMMDGLELFDHTLNTTSSFVINGTGAAKQISSGTLVLQHNLAHYVATSTVTTTLTFSSACCWPTGGSVTTTFSSGRSGSEILTFGPSCGEGSVGGADVVFTHCM